MNQKLKFNIFHFFYYFFRELQAYVELIKSLHKICKNLILIHKSSKNGNLYSDNNACSSKNIITNSFNDIDQECFHGRTTGFQYAESLKPFLIFLDIAMTSQADMYHNNGSICIKFTNLILSFGKYALNPELRAEKYMDVNANASIGFCKYYWQNGETKFMRTLPSIFGRRVEVSHLFEINTNPLTIKSAKFNREINVPLPQSHTGLRPIPVRLISAKRRGRMIGQESSTKCLSDFIILHVSLLLSYLESFMIGYFDHFDLM